MGHGRTQIDTGRTYRKKPLRRGRLSVPAAKPTSRSRVCGVAQRAEVAEPGLLRMLRNGPGGYNLMPRIGSESVFLVADNAKVFPIPQKIIVECFGMTRRAKPGLWAVVIVIAIGASAAILLSLRPRRPRPVVLEGSVIRHDSQAERRQPLSGVQITAHEGSVATSGESDPAGFFRLVLPLSGPTSRPVLLEFRAPGYEPLDLPVVGGGLLYVARLIPTPSELETQPDVPEVKVSNISVRYSVKTTEAANIGSAVRTFQAVNTGNVPCKHHDPCSPDDKWKAARGSVVMDAGQGNEFRNVRVSCIAGPCSFTRIAPLEVPSDVRTIHASALNWSDTATFLVEAEVVHPMDSAEVRKLYPVMFGRVLDFTLPASAEGVCLEADLGGNHIIFPLGPKPDLQWAKCSMRVSLSKSKVYRCELAPGYGF